MLTKAIVEEVLSPYEVRVRIPLLNKIQGSPLATPTEDLNIASVCTLPNCYTNFQVGDIVFVEFEDNTTHKAVILGHLCREATQGTYPDLHSGDLVVHGNSTLPTNTRIGNVTAIELSHLTGLQDNIQRQLDFLSERVTSIENIITDMILNGGAR